MRCACRLLTRPPLDLASAAALTLPAAPSFRRSWAVLLHKIQRPDAYLPATDVVARPEADGSTYREMTVAGARIIEHIFAAPHEVRFVVVNDHNEHVNLISTDAGGVRRLEFFKRDRNTGERVPWPAPAAIALGGIHAVLRAAAASAPAADGAAQ